MVKRFMASVDCAMGREANRLIFPIRQFGKVVYHTNRYCGEHLQKSLNPRRQ